MKTTYFVATGEDASVSALYQAFPVELSQCWFISFISFNFFYAGITGREDLSVGATTTGGVSFYPWTIDNKYYSADIHLCVVPNTALVTGAIAESVQAFVVYFDSSTVRSVHCVALSVWYGCLIVITTVSILSIL